MSEKVLNAGPITHEEGTGRDLDAFALVTIAVVPLTTQSQSPHCKIEKEHTLTLYMR